MTDLFRSSSCMERRGKRVASTYCIGRSSRSLSPRPSAGSGAQAPVTDPRDTTHAQYRRRSSRRRMPCSPAHSSRDALMFPLDAHIAERLRTRRTQANHFFNHASTGVEFIASPGAYMIGGALYAVGRIGKYDRVADLGWHGTEAVLFAQGVTYVLKGIVGRGRPFLSDGERPGRLSHDARDSTPATGHRSRRGTPAPRSPPRRP